MLIEFFFWNALKLSRIVVFKKFMCLFQYKLKCFKSFCSQSSSVDLRFSFIVKIKLKLFIKFTSGVYT